MEFNRTYPIHILAPAKINLFLSIEGKRNDGYHEIFTVICTVSLYDSLFFSFKNKKKISVTCNHPDVLEGRFNIVYKSIKLFFKELDKIKCYFNMGVAVHINKKIPVGAGFGGGSSDAASTILLLNRISNYPFSRKELLKMGEKLGADIPFFIISKPVIATGIGTKFKKFTPLLPKFALLVYPGLVLSTGWVYNNLALSQNLRLTKDKKKITKSYLSAGKFDFGKHLFNDLESVSENRFCVISEIKALLFKSGAVGSLMSGSGSGVFGLFKNLESAVIARDFLLSYNKSKLWKVYLVNLLA